MPDQSEYIPHSTEADKMPEKVLSIGGEQLCPNAKNVTPELIEQIRAAGLSVRAWGVGDIVYGESIVEICFDLLMCIIDVIKSK